MRRLTIALLALAIALAAAAFALPLVSYRDGLATDTPALAMARTEARHASSIPPLSLQLTSFVSGPSGTTATFRWRTIFGVPFGTTHVDGDTTTSEWDVASGVAAWAGFVVVEVALVGGAVVMFVRAR
jgi:hypothetical protein